MFSSPAHYSALFSHNKSWKCSKLIHMTSFLDFLYLLKLVTSSSGSPERAPVQLWLKQTCWPKWVMTMWRGLSHKTTPLVLTAHAARIRSENPSCGCSGESATDGNQPVEERVRTVGGHGPCVLGHGRGNGVCAAILFHAGGQLVA